MKFILPSKTILLLALATCLICPRSQAAENVTNILESMRFAHQADRLTLVGKTLQLTASESADFWPLYRSYRADIDKLGDALVKLVLEYADTYPDVPEDRAKQLLKDYTALDEKLVSKRGWYFKRASKILPAAKALRWAQLENRMDLILRLQLASSIPMMPDTGAKP
jgi:hypothetical protein